MQKTHDGATMGNDNPICGLLLRNLEKSREPRLGQYFFIKLGTERRSGTEYGGVALAQAGLDQAKCLLRPAFLAGRPGFKAVGTNQTSNLEDILGEWTRIHKLTISFVSKVTSADSNRDTSNIDFGQGNVGNILQGMAKHDLHHILKIEEAITRLA